MIELSWFYLCWLWPVLLLSVNASLLCLFTSLFACFLSSPCALSRLLTSSLHQSAFHGSKDAWDEPAHGEGGSFCSALLVVWARGWLFLLLWSLRWGNARTAGFISWWPESRDEEEETDDPNPIQEHTLGDVISSHQDPLLNSKFHNPSKALQASACWWKHCTGAAQGGDKHVTLVRNLYGNARMCYPATQSASWANSGFPHVDVVDASLLRGYTSTLSLSEFQRKALQSGPHRQHDYGFSGLLSLFGSKSRLCG